MFRISCPHCQAPLQVDNHHLGRKVACGKCRQTLLLAVPVEETTQTAVPGNEQYRRLPSRKKRKTAVVAVLAACVLLLVSAVGLKLASRPEERRPVEGAGDHNQEHQHPKSADAKQAEERDAPPNARALPTGEPDPAELDKIVKDYMAASLEDKPRFIMDPERVRPLMEPRFNASTSGANIVPTSIKTRFLGKRTDPCEWYLVRADGQTALGIHGGKNFHFRRTPKGFKIDWEAFAGYNPTPLKVFMAERPETASIFRVECQLSDYYNFAFLEAKDTHFSIGLQGYGPRAFAHGYISKDSPEGKRIFQLVRDGQRHELTLELRHVGPDGSPIDRAGSSVVSITRLVSESWVRK